MRDSAFEVGDVVYLKSGSPRMTVTAVFDEEHGGAHGGDVEVTWIVYSTGELQQAYFDPDALKRAEVKKVYSRYDEEVPY